jgi:uncharacterized repeat protein (TIGR01451 family)
MKPLNAIFRAITGRTKSNIEAQAEICYEMKSANAGEDELHPYKKTMSHRGEPVLTKGVHLLARKTAPHGLLALLARKTAPHGLLALTGMVARVHLATQPVRKIHPSSFVARASVAVLMLSGFAFAQTPATVKPINVASKADVALPLVSIGSNVGWKIGAEDYRLNVSGNLSAASLEVYSPEINLNDYANKTDRKNYYGDELYAKNAKLETSFRVLNAAKQQLVNKKFGSSLKHSFVQLLGGTLNAGFYPMSVQSVGNGKNSFQLRASSGVRVEASQFTVNVRGQFGQDQLVAYLDIGKDAIGQKVTLENYDADGKNEMSLSLIEPTKARALALSENLAWKGDTILVTPDLVGTWKILARVLPTTKQFSNSVAFRFQIGGKPLFARIPGFPTPKTALEPAQPAPTGILQVAALVNTCGSVLPLKAGFRIKGVRYQAPISLRLAPGQYTLEPDQLSGASTQAVSVNVKADTASSANLNYTVALGLKAQPNALELKSGASANLELQVITTFASFVPVLLDITSSDGIALGYVPQGQSSSSKPFTASVAVSANSSGKINISLGAGCPTLEIPVTIIAPEPVAKPAQLQLEKTVDRNEVMAGETVNFTITTRNVGGLNATGIKIVDVLPQGLNGANLQETIDLKAGETRVFKLAAQISSDAKGSILNTATLEGNNQKLSASASVRVKTVAPTRVPAAKLSLTKTVDQFEVAPGDTVNFKITARNTGGTTATAVHLKDVLPAGLKATNLDTVFDLKPAETREFMVTAQVASDAKGFIRNTATLEGNNQTLKASARVHVNVPTIKPVVSAPAKLTLEKMVDKPVAQTNVTVNFTITVRNTGGSSATGIKLSDVMPAGLQGNNLEQTFDLSAGESKVFEIPATITRQIIGTIRNTVNLLWNGKRLKASALVQIQFPPKPLPPTTALPAKLVLEKYADTQSAVAGERVNYTLKVSNTGGTLAQGIKLEDVLPEGLDGKDFWQMFDLEPGQSQEFMLSAQVKNGFSGQIINTARLTWNAEQRSVNLVARATVLVPVQSSKRPASIRLVKFVDRARVSLGDTANFTIIVWNEGDVLARDVKLSDELPSSLSGNNINQSFDLRAHEHRWFYVAATVKTDKAGTLTNTARATFGNATLEESASVYIQAPAVPTPVPAVEQSVIQLEKTVNKANAKPLDTLEYTIRVSNIGNGLAKLVKLEDALPSGVTGKNLSTIFNLKPGETRAFTIPATVDKDAVGTVTNMAVVSLNGVESRATAITKITPVIDLSLRKTVTPTQVRTGDLVTYELEIQNLGPSTATNVKLHDVLPMGLNVLGAKPDQGICATSDDTLDCNLGTLNPGAKTLVVLNATVIGKPGKLVNNASVEATEAEITLENNFDKVTLEILPAATGTLNVNAVAVVCGQRVPLEAVNYSISGETHKTGESLTLIPGSYTLQPASLEGANTQVVNVTINSNQTSTVTLEYSPKLELTLDPAKLELKLGERANVTTTVNTAFPYFLPIKFNLELPDGLQTQDTVTFEGKTRVSEPASFTVSVRAVKTISSGEIRANLEPNCNTANSSVTVTANALPPETRESQILVLAKLETSPSTGFVVLSDRIPAGSQYIKDSSRLLQRSDLDINQQPTSATNALREVLADPLVSGDRLFWVIPANKLKTFNTLSRTKQNTLMMRANQQTREAFGVTYRVSHEGAITIPNDPAIVLILPTRSSSDSRPRVAANSVLGRLVGEGELVLVEGKPEIIQMLQSANASNGILLNDLRPETRDAAVKLEIKLERNTTDPTDQPVLTVRAFDASGNPAKDEFATLEINVEPLTPDAEPNISGYQVRLVNGVARVRLRDLGRGEGEVTPTIEIKVEARVTNENGTISSSLSFNSSELALNSSNPLLPDVTPVSASERPLVASGLASVLFNISFANTTEFSVSGSLRAFARGDLGDGWVLTAAVNWQADLNPNLTLSGSLLPPSNPFERFPILGDASSTGSDIRSSEGIYLKLENGPSYLLYGQITPSFRGLLTNYSPNFNGAQALARGANYQINGFAALVPNADQRFKTRGDGTSFYRLNASVQSSSERVVIVTYDKNNDKIKLSQVVLKHLADYTLDNLSGNLQLTKALFSTDENGNPQYLEVEYADAGSNVPRELRFGVQAAFLATPEFTLSATALQYKPGLNPLYLWGVAANYSSGGFQFALETTFSGEIGNGGGLGLAAQASYTANQFQIQGRYQDTFPGYFDPNTATALQSRNLEVKAVLGDVKDFSINVALNHNQDYALGNSNTKLSARAAKDFGGFSANIGLLLQIAHTPSNADPFSRDLFLTLGAELPLGNWKFGFLQRVPIFPTAYGDTTLSVEYALSSNFSIRLADTLTYEPDFIRQALSLGATGRFSNNELLQLLGVGNLEKQPDAFGTTNIAASYETTNTSGDAGRARVGVDTNIPLGNNWSTQIGGEALFSPSVTGAVSLGARYATDDLQGGAKLQLGFSSAGIKQVYTISGIAKISSELTISPSLEYDVLPEFVKLANDTFVQDGGRYSIAAAWRSDDWNILTNHTGRFGVYAPTGDTIQGEIQFGYNGFERLFIRAGAAYKLNSSAFTAQLGAGFTYFVTDTLGVGANAAYQFQPATSTARLSFGVEASYRILNGFVVTGGFNFTGFQGISSFSTAPGFYVRFDFKFDERLFYGK